MTTQQQPSTVVDIATAIAADAVKDAYMPAHSWGYGQTSRLVDRTARLGGAPRPRHCNCVSCTDGFSHTSGVAR